MKRKRFIAFAIPLLLLAVIFTGCNTSTSPTILEDIQPEEALALIEDNRSNSDFIILDVRTQGEFSEEHIEGAINLDRYSDTFRDELDELNKNKTYLVYCRSGSRSGQTKYIMKELEFKEVYNLSGGIIAWKAKELPVSG